MACSLGVVENACASDDGRLGRVVACLLPVDYRGASALREQRYACGETGGSAADDEHVDGSQVARYGLSFAITL